MSYLVCHMEKYHKTDICHIEEENERDENYVGSNNCIDHTRTKNNYRLLIRNSSYTDFINTRISELNLPKTPRKDAVLMASFVVGSDRDFSKKLDEEQQNCFFRDCTEFFIKRYGRKNIISAVVHNDETTPHLHLNLIPVKDNRLCAKELLNRNELSKLQTDFHEQVGKLWKLKRGKEGSGASHLSTAEFKAKCLLDDAVVKSSEMIMDANEKLEEIEQAVQKADKHFADTMKEIVTAKVERDKIIRERNNEVDYTKSLEDAKQGKFAITKSGLRNQIIALTVENKKLQEDKERIIKDSESNFKLYQSVKKYEPAYRKAQSAIDYICKTEPLAFTRAYFRSPSVMEPFFNMSDMQCRIPRNRLREIEEEIKQEKTPNKTKEQFNSKD